MNTNLKFITIRKFANLEWETFQEKTTGKYLSICHKYNLSVHSDSWDGIWDEIIRSSKEIIKTNNKKR